MGRLQFDHEGQAVVMDSRRILQGGAMAVLAGMIGQFAAAW
jgi:hypothetical protein